MEAIGRREKACVQELARLPPAQVTLCGHGTYQTSREKKLRALDYFLSVAKHVVPSDADITKPSAWHGHLHLENIFIDPQEPTKVTCIIDWQSTEVAPLFTIARQPYFIDYEGPEIKGLERPRLPSNHAELPPEEKEAATRLVGAQSLCVAYRRWISKLNPGIWKSIQFQGTSAGEILVLARTLLVDGEALYAARILEELQSKEDLRELSGLVISAEVKAEIQADAEGALRGMEAMTSVQEAIGVLFPEQGCVRAEQYDESKDALRQCKLQIIDMFATTEAERAAWEECWPFDD